MPAARQTTAYKVSEPLKSPSGGIGSDRPRGRRLPCIAEWPFENTSSVGAAARAKLRAAAAEAVGFSVGQPVTVAARVRRWGGRRGRVEALNPMDGEVQVHGEGMPLAWFTLAELGVPIEATQVRVASSECAVCKYADEHGWWGPAHRGTHCRECHMSWTSGVHCVVCHQQFLSNGAADEHFGDGPHRDPASVEGLHLGPDGLWSTSPDHDPAALAERLATARASRQQLTHA